MSIEHPLIAFNAHLFSSSASYRSAGIAVYIANLLRHLEAESHGLRYQVFLGEGSLPEDITLPVSRSRMPTQKPWQRITWEQTILPFLLWRLGADVLHAPAFVAPLASPCPQVVTVHDLSFLRYPQFFKAGNRLYLRTMTGITCRRAAAVIAVSDFTKREVTSLLGIPENRIFRVYHGVEPRFRPLPREVVEHFRRERELPERFILFLGTLEPRKNLVRLIRAFSQLSDQDLHLILAGAYGWYYEDILREVSRLGITERVHFPGFIPAAEQTLWYNAATAFAYVSLYEGFGMPVLEALACGTPAVTSATTSLPEAGGNGALMVPPEDEAALAEALYAIVSDNNLRDRLREGGLEHARHFSWEAAARQTIKVYQQVLSA